MARRAGPLPAGSEPDLSTEWTAQHRDGAPRLYPPELREEIDALFARLDALSERLTDRRYLVGDTITEADVRLFTTLVRFDAVYHGHFKCNRHKLTELPVLWAYARDLYQTPGFGDTVDFGHIKRHCYATHHHINPTGIVPAGPGLSGWDAPPARESLGGRPFGDGWPPS